MIIFVYIYFIIISSFFSWFIHVGGCRSSYAWHGICAIESHFFSHPLYICVYLALFFLPVQTYNTHTHKHLICYSTHTHTHNLLVFFFFFFPIHHFHHVKMMWYPLIVVVVVNAAIWSSIQFSHIFFFGFIHYWKSTSRQNFIQFSRRLLVNDGRRPFICNHLSLSSLSSSYPIHYDACIHYF